MRSFRRRLRRNRRWVAPLARLVAITSLLLLVGGAVLVWEAFRARAALVDARSAVIAAQAAVTKGDVATARSELRRGAARARAAAAWTSRPWWNAYGSFPLVGPAVREAQGIAHETFVAATQVLPTLVESTGLQGSAWGGRLDVRQLRSVTPALVRADGQTQASLARLRGLPSSGIAGLERARMQLDIALSTLRREVREAAVMAQVLPGVFGADHASKVLVVAQNLAEARATGGLIGAYAVLNTEGGAFRIERSGPGTQLKDASAPVLDMGPEFTARYGHARAAATWRSANLTPDVPSAAGILASLARRQLGVKVDAVVLVDPVALSELLRATGPVSFSDGVLTADRVVSLLLRDLYRAYPTYADSAARDRVFDSALRGVITGLQRPGLSQPKVIRSLRRAIASGHLQLYVTRPADQALLRTVRAGGALAHRGPYLSLITQDVGGSKLDYYLRRAVTYESEPSPVAVDLGAGLEMEESARITIRLSNTAPATGLPQYVTARPDRPASRPAPEGQLRSWVSVYLGARASYSDASLNGRHIALTSHVEQGLSVFSAFVEIEPGETATLVLHVRQPAPARPLLWRQQPRTVDDEVRILRPRARPEWVPFYGD